MAFRLNRIGIVSAAFQLLTSCGKSPSASLTEDLNSRKKPALVDLQKLKAKVQMQEEFSKSLESAFAIYQLERATKWSMFHVGQKKELINNKKMSSAALDLNSSARFSAVILGVVPSTVFFQKIAVDLKKGKKKHLISRLAGGLGFVVSGSAAFSFLESLEGRSRKDREMSDDDKRLVIHQIEKMSHGDGLDEIGKFLGLSLDETRELRLSFFKLVIAAYNQIVYARKSVSEEDFRTLIAETVDFFALARSFPSKKDSPEYQEKVDFLETVAKGLQQLDEMTSDSEVSFCETVELKLEVLRGYQAGLKKIEPTQILKYEAQYKKTLALIEDRIAVLTEIAKDIR